MKNIFSNALVSLILAGCALLSGCGTTPSAPPSLFDFGPLRDATTGQTSASKLPTLSLAEVTAPAWLDTQMMYFRLAYANDQQPRPYANSRWVMPPAQLFEQRIKARLTQSGGIVLAATDGVPNVPVLRIEANDFTQNFDSPEQSNAQIAVRASLFNNHTLIAQKSFVQQIHAPSADAVGGAKAFAGASDALITEMMAWLAALPIK